MDRIKKRSTDNPHPGCRAHTNEEEDNEEGEEEEEEDDDDDVEDGEVMEVDVLVIASIGSSSLRMHVAVSAITSSNTPFTTASRPVEELRSIEWKGGRGASSS